MPKYRLPQPKFSGRGKTEQISDKQDYKRNIFNQVERITILGTHNNKLDFINGIKQLRYLLIAYISREEAYVTEERKIIKDYKEDIKKATSNKAKFNAQFKKWKRIYIELQLLIGSMGFLPELEGEFVEGEEGKGGRLDFYDQD